MQLFHGLAAYRGTRQPLQQIRAADRCMGAEVCTADRPIGPIGLLVRGEITAAHEEDCWSYVDQHGVRRSGTDRCSVSQWLELDNPAAIERWLKELAAYSDHDYAELFCIVGDITGVWVKPYADKQTRMVARIIARRYGVRVLTVERHSRPWDVVGAIIDDDYNRAVELAQRFGVADDY